MNTILTDVLGGDHEELAGSDQSSDSSAEDLTIRSINPDEDAFEKGTWSTAKSEQSHPESDLESDLDVDAFAENVEITEGGWICRVERFEKHVDSRGRITYHHPPKRSSPPPVNHDLRDARNAETLEPDETESDVPQSIIAYFHHAAKSSSRFEPEIYIEIKSPLILEVLRQNESHRV